MSVPNSRESLKLWALRRLGYPVIEINVEDDQLDDRIDEALQFFQEGHFDGVERVYVKHEITSNDITNMYITIDSSYIGVRRILPLAQSGFGGSSNNIFSAKYQFALNDLWRTNSNNIEYYNMVMSHMDLLDFMFNTVPQIEFNKHKNQIQITMDWSQVTAGQYLIIEAYKIIDPNNYSRVWNDSWLKRYVVALFKLQWGNNLRKYQGLQLPGGLTMDGQSIMQEAQQEIDLIKEQFSSAYELPIDMIVG